VEADGSQLTHHSLQEILIQRTLEPARFPKLEALKVTLENWSSKSRGSYMCGNGARGARMRGREIAQGRIGSYCFQEETVPALISGGRAPKVVVDGQECTFYKTDEGWKCDFPEPNYSYDD